MAKDYVPYDGPIVTRAEALERGHKRFFDGKPCGKGHISERWTSVDVCIWCRRLWCEKNKDCVRSLQRKYSLSAAAAACRARWIALHPSGAKEATKKWRLANPEKNRIYRHNRRIARGSGIGRYTAAEAKGLLLKQRFKCAEGSISIKGARHLDHIMPIALGGSNSIKNLQWLCPSCNLKKAAKHPIDWAQENGRLL